MTKEFLLLDGIMAEEYKGRRRIKTMEVDSEDTIYSLMLRVEEITGVAPVFQRIHRNSRGCKYYYYDSPGTLAENKLVPSYPVTISVDFIHSGHDFIQRDTLRNMGFCVHNDRYPEKSAVSRAYAAALASGKPVMFITVIDYIRMDGGGMEMVVVALADDTVASIMEEVQRRRRYPVAMQELTVGDAGSPGYKHTPMDKLDATLAEYNVTKDKHIFLYFSKAFGMRAYMEARGLDKPKEIAASPGEGEQQKPADDEEK